ncbi:MAG: ABC transporter permease [Ardenticatenaceae bacterium]|nr:ABC transporter permease [Ardenticatenaceae bacterium]
MVIPRWKKVLADLWGNKVRTFLVALSIAVGVFAVGFVVNAYLILEEDIPADYLAANPHAALIYTDPFEAALLNSARRVPGVQHAVGRSEQTVKVGAPDGRTYPLQIVSYPRLAEAQIDLLRLEQGAPTLSKHEVYLERQAAEALGYTVGDTLHALLNDGTLRDLRIAGIVQDVAGNHFPFTKVVSVYGSLETLAWMGGVDQYTELLLTVSEGGSDADHVRQVANAVADKLSKSGLRVFATVVNNPGQQPHQQILDAMLALMGGLGVLALALSAFLVINTISGLMGQQIRQIGVMKAVGATMGQITAVYLLLVALFGVAALLVAVPAAAVGAYALCLGIAGRMDFNLAPFRVPLTAVWLQVAVGLGVPIVSALLPVLSGARLTVREAISNYGLSPVARQSWFDRVLEAAPALPRPLLLSIRNTFRRKGRLVLTLSTLTLGGAIFIAVFGVRSSIYDAVEKTFGYTLGDVNVTFSRDYRIEQLQAAVRDVPGVVAMEGWSQAMAQVLNPDGEGGDDVQVIAPPAGSKLIEPVLTDGRWLLPEDQNTVVVGNHFVKMRPETAVGDTIELRLNERDYPFQIVGIYEMAGSPTSPIVFMNYDYLSVITNKVRRVDRLRIVTDRSDPERQTQVQQALATRLQTMGMDAYLQTGSDTFAQQTALVKVLIALLVAMAMLIAVVGGLGLMGTMSMNVLERTREIGVMRSLGAVDLDIFQLVVVEGLLIGLISWALGALLSVPIAQALDRLVGVAMLNVPLRFFFSAQGLWIWLIVVLFLSALASLLPARSAVRLTVRDVLAYE